MGAPLLKRQSLKQVVPATAQPIPSRPYSALSDSCLGRAYQRSMEGHGKIMRWESWSQVFLPITLQTEIWKRATIFRQDFFLRLFFLTTQGVMECYLILLSQTQMIRVKSSRHATLTSTSSCCLWATPFFEKIISGHFRWCSSTLRNDTSSDTSHLFFRWSFLSFNMFQHVSCFALSKTSSISSPCSKKPVPWSASFTDLSWSQMPCSWGWFLIHQKDTKTHNAIHRISPYPHEMVEYITRNS